MNKEEQDRLAESLRRENARLEEQVAMRERRVQELRRMVADLQLERDGLIQWIDLFRGRLNGLKRTVNQPPKE